MSRTSKSPTSRDLQAIERRKQLLDAATELFAEQGYHATPIRSINQKIGMADGLLYHYFPGGKLEILQTIVKEAVERRIERFDSLARDVDEEKPLRDILISVYRTFHDVFMKDHKVLAIQLREKDLLEEELMKLNELIFKRMQWAIHLLESRAAKGEIRMMDFEMAGKHFISVWMAFVIRDFAGVDLVGGDKDMYIHRMVDYILDLWAPR